MKLTVRTLNEQVRETVLQRIHDIAVAQAESFNATATLTHVNGSPVLKNDPAANQMVREVATSLFGRSAGRGGETVYGQRRFCLYART
ncbi:amidohydrolase [Raoultella planticola]|uniref:Amidohydrolase n=1 Tax=Raoultella planticola TaxID=575 RepID=A0A485AIX4_RAOPL|nr:amidohydrolase [Raoultella planticola]